MFHKKIILMGCVLLGLLAIPNFAHAAKINLNFGLGLIAGPRYCAPCPVYYQPVPVVIQSYPVPPPCGMVVHRRPACPRPYAIHQYYYPYSTEVVEYYHY